MTTKDKRSTPEDRRLVDLGPPSGWLERRRRAERRMPQAAEIEVSESEWLAYFSPKPATPPPLAVNEQAADIFARQRS